MIKKNSIEDPSPLRGVYEGDLKYGRACETVVITGKDFQANRSEDGQAVNKPVVSLPMQSKRDAEVWKKSEQRIKKSEVGDGVDVLSSIAWLGRSEYKYGLIQNISRIKQVRA